jgi:DNA excision repair protein ERCC-4
VADARSSPSERRFVVVVDSREQRPYRFDEAVVKLLPSGDYSLLGFEERVAIERKSKKDAYASLGRERERFEREVERLSRFEYAAIVVEASLKGFLSRPDFSQLNPKTAINSLLAWSVKHGVYVFFAGDRIHGHAVTRCLLEKFWRYRVMGGGEV